MNSQRHTFLFLLSLALITNHCSFSYQPATFQFEDHQLWMDGVIDGNTPDRLRAWLAKHPSVQMIVMVRVEGSVNDEANLEAARIVRRAGLHTHVPANGLIASGGTDFFLAGAVRTIEIGAQVGVHSWAEQRKGTLIQGKDVPREAPIHQMYLAYYRDMKIPEEFYWFTLHAADAEDIYWMSREDMTRFNFLTEATPTEESSSQK